MLGYCVESTYKRLTFISLCRSLLLMGILGLGSPSFDDAVLIMLGLLSHYIVSPYFGFKLLSPKSLVSYEQFVPLRPWLIDCGKRELTGHEYEVVLNESALSPMGKEQLHRIQKQGFITVYDYVNLHYFEECLGKPNEWIQKDKYLKEAIKDKFGEQ